MFQGQSLKNLRCRKKQNCMLDCSWRLVVMRVNVPVVVPFKFLHILCLIDKENAVKVVNFMLENVCHQAACTPFKHFSFFIVGTDCYFCGTFYFSIEPPHRKT